MKKGKKLIALILSVLFIALSLSACSGKTETVSLNTEKLKNFKANVFDIEVGDTATVKFTVEAAEGTKESISLYKTGDASSLGTMVDDGTNGDSISGDGIFTFETEITAETKENAEYYSSINEQTKSNTFTISFYEELTEEQIQGFYTLNDEVSYIESFEEAKEYVSNSAEVESYKIDEDHHTITYRTTYGITGMWVAYEDGFKGSTTSVDGVTPPEGDQYESVFNNLSGSDIGTTSTKKSVLVVRPFRSSQFKYDDFMYAGIAIARATGGKCDVYDDNNADLDVFKSFGQYGAVLVDSHGGLFSGNRTVMVTGDIMDADEMQEYSADLQSERIIMSDSRACVASTFFDKYYSTNSLSDTTAFLGTCYSAYNNSFGDSLTKKGASLVLGYSDAVGVSYCNDTLYEFMIENLLLGCKEASEAFDETVKTCGSVDPSGDAEFVMFKRGESVTPFSHIQQADDDDSDSSVSFDVPETLDIKLGDAYAIEPEITASGNASYNIYWSSSNNSIVTVNAEGSACIVTSIGIGTATVTGTLVSKNGTTITASTEVTVTPAARDVVLVLDCSGSMDGEPFTTMKTVARQFCEDLIKDGADNRVAVVTYDTDVQYSGFTSDIANVESFINGLDTGGLTNMVGAVDQAERLIVNSGNSEAVQNVVIMADGLPNEGMTSASGSFSNSYNGSSYAYYNFEYENAVVDSANRLKGNCDNIYSLGFFHDLSGDSLNCASALMKMIASDPANYYSVDDPQNLNFAFGDIGYTITDGSRIIINIACPVDVTVSADGYSLSSADGDGSNELGSVKLLGSNKDVKVFSLDPNYEYSVDFSGTDTGTMDYSVNYIDENNRLSDTRSFSNVPLSDTTVMKSSTENSGVVALDIDSDGDGNSDDVWEAGKGSAASSSTQHTPSVTVERSGGKSSNWQIWLIIGLSTFVVILLIIIIVLAVKNKKNKPEDAAEGRETSPEPLRPVPPAVAPRTPNIIKNPLASVDDTSVLGASHESRNIKIVIKGNVATEFLLNDNQTYNVGKDRSWANIVLPGEFSKISREHCTLRWSKAENCFYITDKSTNGTYYRAHGQTTAVRAKKGVETKVNADNMIYLANKDCYLKF